MVDLWCYAPDDDDDDNPSAVSEWMARERLLSAAERARSHAYQFARDRRTFVAARALLRGALSSYLPTPPGRWQFSADEHGKPSIASPKHDPRLHFSVSHTAGLVVCVIASGHSRLGVDVETLDRSVDISEIARDHFAPDEVCTLDALTGAQRQRRFIEHWTLKESYAKGRGVGLSVPFNRYSFELSHADAVTVRCVDDQDADAERWQFALVEASPRHLIAVAVDTGGVGLRLRAARVTPFHAAPCDGGWGVLQTDTEC